MRLCNPSTITAAHNNPERVDHLVESRGHLPHVRWVLLEVLRDGGERLAVMRGREAVVARASAWQGERVCAAAVAAHARPAAVHRSCAVA